MDTLSVSTIEVNGSFEVRYKMVTQGAKVATVSGVLTVSLNTRFPMDRPILAELGALHHLLYIKEIHGQRRLGNGLRIEVSAGAIKKAVAKGSLKREDSGKTDKEHVARFCAFLATKYFEATVEVVQAAKWADMSSNRQVNESIAVDDYPDAKLSCVLGEVVVRRHALNRFVERFTAATEIAAGTSIVEIPDGRWTRAWKSLDTILPQAETVSIPPKEAKRIAERYGPGVIALQHRASQSVFILKQNSHGLSLVTVLCGDEYCKLTELPTQAGQKLVYSR